jgi:hypothetical protein
MIKNYRDIIVLLITAGVLILLATIIVGDYIVALEENRPVDEIYNHAHEDECYWFNRRNRRLYWRK